MQTRWLLNIGLALLVGALILLVLYKPGARKESPGTPLTALSVEAVQHIRLLRPKQADVLLEKTAGTWQMTAPRRARVNSFRVNELLRLAVIPASARFAANSAELGKFGLDQPLATLYLNDVEIRFGSMHPLNSQVYVLHDNQVQLIPALVFQPVSAPYTDFLSPGLMDEKTKITSLTFPDFGLKQNAQGAWVRTPELKNLGSDQVNRFVDEWRYARALSVAPASGKAVKVRVVLTIADGDTTRRIEFGVLARKPEFVIVRLDESLEYSFPEETGARLLQLKPE